MTGVKSEQIKRRNYGFFVTEMPIIERNNEGEWNGDSAWLILMGSGYGIVFSN